MWPNFAEYMNKGPLLALVLAAALLSGCASAPVDNNVMPTSDTPSKPAAPVKDAEGKHRYVLALMAKEDWHKAAEELEHLTAARPKLPGPWVNLGIVRTMLGDSTAAEAAFKAALDADAGMAEAWNQLGMLYRRSGHLEKARAAYNAGLERSPDHADLHWNLALLHDRHLPDPVLALTHYERYQQLTKSEDPQLQQWITKLREQVPATKPEKMTAEAGK
ncbi:MAG: tetratricopeptide repeat protein [Gammaproteobacteria bacterium]|nr:tetratricopeptide repeat protein [Gammaproteobacteria bacterium]